MATEKITIPCEDLEAFRAGAGHAGVKILTETEFGKEKIMQVRFRQPASLYLLGRLVQGKPTIPLKQKTKNEKATKKAT